MTKTKLNIRIKGRKLTISGKPIIIVGRIKIAPKVVATKRIRIV